MSDIVADVMRVGMDLSETSLRAAMDLVSEPETIICSVQDAILAGRLAEKLGIKNIVALPKVPTDDWCLVGKFSAVYNEGA